MLYNDNHSYRGPISQLFFSFTMIWAIRKPQDPGPPRTASHVPGSGSRRCLDPPGCQQKMVICLTITHRIHGAGIYANIWGILMVNVTIYSIHGSYG